MKIVFYVALTILVILAIASGVSKIFLLQREVEFFGQFGFTNPILVVYGISQLVGGLLLALQKTRIIGAVVVAVTFLISAVILGMSGNIPITIVTLLIVALIGFVVKISPGK